MNDGAKVQISMRINKFICTFSRLIIPRKQIKCYLKEQLI